MKALIELGINFFKKCLAKRGVDKLVNLAKHNVGDVMGKVAEQATKHADEIKRVDEIIDIAEKLHDTAEKNLGEAAGKLDSLINSKEEGEVEILDQSPSSKAFFDVKFHDMFDDKETDKQLVVHHHTETRKANGTMYQVVVIDDIEERERSNRNHNPDRNLAARTDSTLVQTLRMVYEPSGIEIKEMFHLHIPGTKIQDI